MVLQEEENLIVAAARAIFCAVPVNMRNAFGPYLHAFTKRCANPPEIVAFAAINPYINMHCIRRNKMRFFLADVIANVFRILLQNKRVAQTAVLTEWGDRGHVGGTFGG